MTRTDNDLDATRYPRRLQAQSAGVRDDTQEVTDTVAYLQHAREAENGILDEEFVYRLQPGAIHLVVGAPGSGKTDFLRWLHACEERPVGPSELIRMRDWANRPAEFKNRVTELVDTDERRCILVDGLDEARDLASHIVSLLRSGRRAEERAGSTWVITCRSADAAPLWTGATDDHEGPRVVVWRLMPIARGEVRSRDPELSEALEPFGDAVTPLEIKLVRQWRMRPARPSSGDAKTPVLSSLLRWHMQHAYSYNESSDRNAWTHLHASRVRPAIFELAAFERIDMELKAHSEMPPWMCEAIGTLSQTELEWLFTSPLFDEPRTATSPTAGGEVHEGRSSQPAFRLRVFAEFACAEWLVGRYSAPRFGGMHWDDWRSWFVDARTEPPTLIPALAEVAGWCARRLPEAIQWLLEHEPHRLLSLQAGAEFPAFALRDSLKRVASSMHERVLLMYHTRESQAAVRRAVAAFSDHEFVELIDLLARSREDRGWGDLAFLRRALQMRADSEPLREALEALWKDVDIHERRRELILARLLEMRDVLWIEDTLREYIEDDVLTPWLGLRLLVALINAGSDDTRLMMRGAERFQRGTIDTLLRSRDLSEHQLLQLQVRPSPAMAERLTNAVCSHAGIRGYEDALPSGSALAALLAWEGGCYALTENVDPANAALRLDILLNAFETSDDGHSSDCESKWEDVLRRSSGALGLLLAQRGARTRRCRRGSVDLVAREYRDLLRSDLAKHKEAVLDYLNDSSIDVAQRVAFARAVVPGRASSGGVASVNDPGAAAQANWLRQTCAQLRISEPDDVLRQLTDRVVSIPMSEAVDVAPWVGELERSVNDLSRLTALRTPELSAAATQIACDPATARGLSRDARIGAFAFCIPVPRAAHETSRMIENLHAHAGDGAAAVDLLCTVAATGVPPLLHVAVSMQAARWVSGQLERVCGREVKLLSDQGTIDAEYELSKIASRLNALGVPPPEAVDARIEALRSEVRVLAARNDLPELVSKNAWRSFTGWAPFEALHRALECVHRNHASTAHLLRVLHEGASVWTMTALDAFNAPNETNNTDHGRTLWLASTLVDLEGALPASMEALEFERRAFVENDRQFSSSQPYVVRSIRLLANTLISRPAKSPDEFMGLFSKDSVLFPLEHRPLASVIMRRQWSEQNKETKTIAMLFDADPDLVEDSVAWLRFRVCREIRAIAATFTETEFDYGDLFRRAKETDDKRERDTNELNYQVWLAAHLRLGLRGIAHVSREVELANFRRPDIVVSVPSGAEVRVELKVADSWPLKELESALDEQLSAYIEGRGAALAGVLVVVSLRQDRTWAREDGPDLNFASLVKHLRKRAEDLTFTPDVVAIDLSSEASMKERNVRKRTKGAPVPRTAP